MAPDAIQLMTDEAVKQYYDGAIFDFNDNYTPEDPADPVDHHFKDQNERFLARTSEISKIEDKKGYDEHTDLLHDYCRNPEILKNYFIFKNKAFLKLCEIFDVFRFDTTGKEMRSFHLCEGPGYFIDATHLYLLRSSPISPSNWTWSANTLNPYHENISCFDKLIDDSHIRGHEAKWYFGPDDDGDVKKLTKEYLEEKGLMGTMDLVTADGSTNTQGREGNIEEIVNDLILSEVKASLLLLRKNGRLILKMYRFYLPETRGIMMLLAKNFAKIRAIKPMTSRPGSAERYIVCDGFGGKVALNDRTLLQCDEFFLEKQLKRLDLHLESFGKNQLKYTWNDRKKFMESMRERFFTKKREVEKVALEKMFRSESSKISPWRELYGHNLIRRFQEYSTEELPMAIGKYVNTAPVFPTFSESRINSGSMIDYILKQENLVVSTPVKLDIQDSLFCEPIAFQGLLSIKPPIYYDPFQSASTLKDIPPEIWIRRLKITKGGHYTLEMAREISIENILAVLKRGISRDMSSFTLIHLPDCGPPLFLSRLSASMFCLLSNMFKEMDVGNGQIRWSESKTNDNIAVLLDRLFQDVYNCRRGNSVRCFMPLSILDLFHPIICYENVSRMTVLWPEIEKKGEVVVL